MVAPRIGASDIGQTSWYIGVSITSYIAPGCDIPIRPQGETETPPSRNSYSIRQFRWHRAAEPPAYNRAISFQSQAVQYARSYRDDVTQPGWHVTLQQTIVAPCLYGSVSS